ncbi:MAG: hypothetical protein Fur002_23700 [Anaerolineales bacterium]
MQKLHRLLFLLPFALACSLLTPSPEAPLPIVTEAPVETAAPAAPRSLTVCIGGEPESLYPLNAELSASARSVLAAVYDDPYDLVNYQYQPSALTQVPSLDNGDAQIVPAQAGANASIVDADGNLTTLSAGARFRPSGCRADDCVTAYDGVSTVTLDQMVVTFRLRPELTWSDGIPVTADDSVYAYQIASADEAHSFIVPRTQTYEAADAQTVQWWGVPGFIDSSYQTNFFPPAPKHAWEQFTPAQLPEIDLASRAPLGWGAYVIKQWAAGDFIKLEKNPYYFRAAEGLPKFDELTFRFISDPNIALTELIAKRCDILDPSIRLDNHVGLLMEMQRGEQAQYFAKPGMSIEWLGMGIVPASYDDGYGVDFQTDRQDIFGDAHTRQGIVYCLNRQAIVDSVLFGLSSVPASYIPPEHPLYDPNVSALPFDPASGKSLLAQAGWRDTDGKPETPLAAVTVKNVRPGTPLLLNYYATDSTQRKQIVSLIEPALKECGIGLNVRYFSQNELYASGPAGLVFGRKFDLAEYAMGVEGIVPACNWFASAQIPNAQNDWIGTNLSGYNNPAYDSACRRTQFSLPEEDEYLQAYRATQITFSEDLPAIPLFYRLRVSAARPDLCGYSLDATANPMWNIEAFDIGECQ